MTHAMSSDLLWQTKLAARIHDPAEKALVLLRDPAGHEGGTSRALKRLLGLEPLPQQIDSDNDDVLSTVLFHRGVSREVYRHVQRADWWAAAADRPQWPMQEITVTTKRGEEKTIAVAPWARVDWAQQPVLIHPLTGAQFDLGRLGETDIHDLKERSFAHFSGLLKALGAEGDAPQDWRKTLLAYWRFGPELTEEQDNGKLGALWPLLPADTRVPDHSIWDHLDLTSAFAGAFVADPKGEAALLAVSIGPVQSFIAAARSTSDLWAGSHLLSRLAWETMRPVCEALGPDAILFPRLRGIPQVDLWLRDQMGLPDRLFEGCEWRMTGTDANPLFSAALPNRFVAVVPASQARELAERCAQAVRAWLAERGQEVVRRLLEVANPDPQATPTPFEQMREQLAGFPEVHWAAVPFSLIRPRNEDKQTDLDVSALLDAMAPFFGVEPGKPCGFLDTPAWQALAKDIDWGDGTTFFAPNPGVLYPAVYDLAERVLAAAKAARTFEQQQQQGWRDALSGEVEWLTTDRTQLALPPGQRTDTLWTRVADRKPAWARKGEHLGALSALKRLWPTMFAEEVSQALGKDVSRFVVSTHTMALAHQLDWWLERGGHAAAGTAEALKDAEPVALPRRLTRRHAKKPALADAKRLPGLLEAARDDEDEKLADAQKKLRLTLGTALNQDEAKLETYYAMLMMDGDRMGAILSGEDHTSITYRQSFHPQVQTGFDRHAARQPLIQRYGAQKRPVSPNRHLAISGALNDFSQTVVRHVVEEEHLGRVIYAGGDDVLAMLPVADLLRCMQRLRHAYSGAAPEDEALDWGNLGKDPEALHCKAGFAWLRGRLMRMMGERATASTGAVIAHYQAPLAAVLRELRAAEKRAKSEGGRDAFSITVIKRSGGALYLTAEWGEPLALLGDLIEFLRDEGTSRRAVYRSLEWLRDLPDPGQQPAMLEKLLAYQLDRQSGGDARKQEPVLAARLTRLAVEQGGEAREWLANFLSVAEFLARETRGGLKATMQQEKQAA
ncbi:CRISPR-associated protein Cas10/Cmr2, subtype III-B [Tepidimonas sediminis]|uniref:CRISPR-associated protein Cas10/Cmr2, subtype III-B n=1 Tax=Tepidimonas sediminis TaxID=2588941 RepID=A0A554WUW1_9BURK|nr:type III-B CRISPR-associated protein Cas10/Cmr2 [Tepidimonas sediminis]TSE27357.1 CRISPR-associated protein Cas10/Cmr2, subtype III-B [Tepidimonas sediminis]